MVVRVTAAVPELLTMGSRRESGVAGVQVGVHVGVTPSWGCCAALAILCPLKLSPPNNKATPKSFTALQLTIRVFHVFVRLSSKFWCVREIINLWLKIVKDFASKFKIKCSRDFYKFGSTGRVGRRRRSRRSCCVCVCPSVRLLVSRRGSEGTSPLTTIPQQSTTSRPVRYVWSEDVELWENFVHFR